MKGHECVFMPTNPLGDPFSLTILEAAWITGTDGWNTQHRDVAYDLGPAPFKAVKLIVDLASDCYPWDKWQSDPPPAGQNWPASCDAFDRTMGFISDPAADASDPPGFELLRSITPFGGPAHIEADITDYANAHPGEHDLRTYINTWPDGAGQVSGSAGDSNDTSTDSRASSSADTGAKRGSDCAALRALRATSSRSGRSAASEPMQPHCHEGRAGFGEERRVGRRGVRPVEERLDGVACMGEQQAAALRRTVDRVR